MSAPGVVVMVRYVALAGQEQLAAQESSALVAMALAKERKHAGVLRAADGTVVEVLERLSTAAIERAPAPQSIRR